MFISLCVKSFSVRASSPADRSAAILRSTDELLNLFTTIHDGNFRRHSSMYLIKSL